MAMSRILEVLRETFWILALAAIALFGFFLLLGAVSFGDAMILTVVVAILCVAWIVHGIAEGRHRDRRDPELIRARERRGF
jgi:uncharacterized membrane protein YhaH (DUF805 family)